MKNNSRVHSGSACCHVVWNILFGVMLLENVGLRVCECDSLYVFMGVNLGVLYEM
jgi:hypothetical protein